ncbi:MAG: ferrous iron transport protein B [Firmicutes bacterium]|nr:ferrous iron transport protein B [Bacillota bacterium]
MNKRILIVGNPNVGKSVIFNKLTGIYVTVSNYPGTTVEITKGYTRLPLGDVEVIDTPGLYSLLPITDEERVSRRVLFANPGGVALQVADARNLARMLPLTFQLIQAGFQVVLAVNMLDEAARDGWHLDLETLSQQLELPVVGTVATNGEGLDQLKEALTSALLERGKVKSGFRPSRSKELQAKLDQVTALLTGNYPLSQAGIAALLVSGDREIEELVKKTEKLGRWRQLKKVLAEGNGRYKWGPGYQLALEDHAQAAEIVEKISTQFRPRAGRWRDWLSILASDPVSGSPILLAVVYLGLYQFVGRFGAGFLVDFLDQNLFRNLLIPASRSLVTALIPSPFWNSLFIGDYGILTLGVRYAVAIILPIVGCFFFFFSLLEDSGYLPRLAMLMDRACKRIGLNGRAVIPMVLGLGCDTMATMTTRILETKRERIIATFLLALAVPCSAQLGVILALLSPYPGAVLVWATVVLFVLLLTGHLLGRFLPGNPPLFYLEVPPLRLPRLSNILVKTYSRMQWYFLEVLPVFIGVSVAVWAGKVTGVFRGLLHLIEPVMAALGLPKEAAACFLFGFFRRDYGAAGLFDLAHSGALSTRNLVTAAVTLTLFLPCVAQFAVMWKERGPVVSLLIVTAILPLAFSAGYLVNLLLLTFGL